MKFRIVCFIILALALFVAYELLAPNDQPKPTPGDGVVLR